MKTAFDTVAIAAPALAMGALAWCAITDLRTYTIANWACAAVALLWVVSTAMRHEDALGPLLVSSCILLGGVALFARGLMGGGDVKLLPAAALWAGPHGLAAFSIVAGLTAAAVALLILSPARRLLPAPPAGLAADTDPLQRPMPFGVAISAGGLWAVANHLPAII
ncbi:MAG TPA: prepilin peptidase [Caulobacteraceae bacterium]|jgi:prepilin peptidase CpaA|nr:prepilin peptidase [Caulobacteraceae bacterium]